jgi:hypothetical protein
MNPYSELYQLRKAQQDINDRTNYERSSVRPKSWVTKLSLIVLANGFIWY